MTDSKQINHPFPSYKKNSTLPNIELLSTQKFLNLTDLLPYNPDEKTQSRLKDGLKEYLFLVKIALEAFRTLAHKKINKFDPLVGENACQIRSVINALILSKNIIDAERSLPILSKIQEELSQILESQKYLQTVITSGESLKDLIKNKKFNFQLSAPELFLIESYILTKVKVQKAPKPEMPLCKNESTDTKRLKTISPIGSMFADRLVKHLRESVSKSSVIFIQQISEQLYLPDPILDTVSDNYLINYRKLSSLPYFWMTFMLMHFALRERLPIVVRGTCLNKNHEKIGTIIIAYKAIENKYTPVDPLTLSDDSPTIVLSGTALNDQVATWKKKLFSSNPFDLILAYAAAHRQFPNEQLSLLTPNPISYPYYSFYNQNALEWGCSLQNPSCFFLSHAYCDLAQNAILNHHHTTETSAKILA